MGLKVKLNFVYFCENILCFLKCYLGSETTLNRTCLSTLRFGFILSNSSYLGRISTVINTKICGLT